MIFYCGVNEKSWNHHPVMPGPFACIAPVYGASTRTKRKCYVKIPRETAVIQDSGAFSDGPGDRLSPECALERQEEHAHEMGYANQITQVASYDLLIDEMWQDGQRLKGRWSEKEAWSAVETTIRAAEYLSRNYHRTGRILSVQGVTPSQYLICAESVIPLLVEGDVLGLGGWCISGKMPKRMMGVFSRTMNNLIPYAASNGVGRIHIWGVIDSEFLGPLLWLCDQSGIELSTDSAGPQMRPARNGQWGYKGWSNPNYERPDPKVRGIHRRIHVILTRQWLEHGLRQSVFYHQPTETRIKLNGNTVQRSLL